MLSENCIIINPIRQVKLLSSYQEVLVPNREPHPGVFIANTLVKSDRALIRILNTNENTITLKQHLIQTEDVNDYEIYGNKSCNRHRKSEILQILKRKFPDVN